MKSPINKQQRQKKRPKFSHSVEYPGAFVQRPLADDQELALSYFTFTCLVSFIKAG